MITIKIETKDNEGKIVGVIETPAQTLVHNFVRMLQIHMNQTIASVESIDGEWIDQGVNNYDLMASVVAGISRVGIVVGTVSSPVSLLDATLMGIIRHGTQPGQLLYQSVTFTAPTDSASLVQFQLSRIFLNRSGAPATISEIGIYTQAGIGTVMVDRTIIPTPVTIPNLGQVTIVYTFKGTLG